MMNLRRRSHYYSADIQHKIPLLTDGVRPLGFDG